MKKKKDLYERSLDELLEPLSDEEMDCKPKNDKNVKGIIEYILIAKGLIH